MINCIRKMAIVGKNGKIELLAPELPEGTALEIIMLVTPEQEDETTYLLQSDANKKHLLNALDNVKKGNLSEVDINDLEKNFSILKI